MIQKQIEKSIKVPIFFYELILDISQEKDYLISEIEKGINENSNLNYITNVVGQMTSWNYFKNNKTFIEVLDRGITEIEQNINLPYCFLEEAWGIKVSQKDYTKEHSHGTSTYSGILYLNEDNIPILFPQLNLEIFPQKGTFLLFSSCLTHKTKKHISSISKYAIPFNFKEVIQWTKQ